MSDQPLDLGNGNTIYQPPIPADLRQTEPVRAFDAASKAVQTAIKAKADGAQNSHHQALDGLAGAYDRIAAHLRQANDYGSTPAAKRDREAFAWAARGLAQLHGTTLRMIGFNRSMLASHFASSPARRAQGHHFNVSPQAMDAASARRA